MTISHHPREDPHRPRLFLLALIVALLTTTACTGGSEDGVHGAGSSVAATPAAANEPFVVNVAGIAIPDGPLGVSIRRGQAIMMATRDSLPANVGNGLRCTTCHLDAGTRENSMPWTGVYARFPQYRSRTGSVIRLEDRVNDCLLRSLNGAPLEVESDAMRDIVAYMAHLSQGVPVGATVRGQGLARLEPLPADTVRGRAIFDSRCVACHGVDGQGTGIAPALWGPESYNIGAGMSRLNTAAAFIKHNMPLDAANLTDQQAYDVAAYVISRPRPDFPGKENDWPNGDPPPDVAYRTRAAR